jgi:hypothetical protein
MADTPINWRKFNSGESAWTYRPGGETREAVIVLSRSRYKWEVHRIEYLPAVPDEKAESRRVLVAEGQCTSMALAKIEASQHL